MTKPIDVVAVVVDGLPRFIEWSAVHRVVDRGGMPTQYELQAKDGSSLGVTTLAEVERALGGLPATTPDLLEHPPQVIEHTSAA